MCMYITYVPCAHGSQKILDSLKLELQVLVSQFLGAGNQQQARVASALYQ